MCTTCVTKLERLPECELPKESSTGRAITMQQLAETLDPGDTLHFNGDVYRWTKETTTTTSPRLPIDSATRKSLPIATGVLGYFPLAVAYVSLVSKVGNDQHNPGEPLRWAREKSTDHADCITRHLIDRGTNDTDGLRHSGKLAWRALAALQVELEAALAAGEDPWGTR
jgi:hypothetical protein